LDKGRLKKGLVASELFAETGLCASKGDAKRLISQGGAYVNGRRLQDIDEVITDEDFQEGSIVLRAGKKRFHRAILKKG
jgi:tyrosyl-tRNA synthetase